MKTEYNIPFHSFVDLITNSSSEVYVDCDKRTVEIAYMILDEILKPIGVTGRDAAEIKLTTYGWSEKNEKECDFFEDDPEFEDQSQYGDVYIKVIIKDEYKQFEPVCLLIEKLVKSVSAEEKYN